MVSYRRHDGDRMLITVLNLTPIPRDNYRIGAPRPGRYVQRLNTDDPAYGGSGYSTPATLDTEPASMHGFPQSLRLTLPPLAALVLEPVS